MSAEPFKNQALGYRNIFTVERRDKRPMILEDGTSIVFPDNWTDEQAETWRKYACLSRPRADR